MRPQNPASTTDNSRKDALRAEGRDAVIAAVAEAAERLRFGAIQLTIHDGRVVQLDVTERQRFT